MNRLFRIFKRINTFILYLLKLLKNYRKSDLNLFSTINYNNKKLLFINSNNILRFRINHFKTKEPETLKWIESFPENSNMWDIGANIGAFSIFASKIKNCDVVSFEPSYLNLNILSKNIYLNNIQNKVTIFPLAVNDESNIGMFKTSDLKAGHANSSFDNGLGFDGKPLNINFEYKTISMRLDLVREVFKLKQPDYIKIDVDGNEHLVLKGAKNTLQNVKEILIELPGVWKEQTEISHTILKESGFSLVKEHNYDEKNNPEASANEIWKRL